MKKHGTIEISAHDFVDCDDSLSAAAASLVRKHPDLLRNYEMSARWLDDERETILVDVPERLLATLSQAYDIHVPEID